MTRLHKLAVGGAAAALIMTGAVSKSFAIEAGDFQYLAGGTIGLPLGAAPPAGVYTGLTTFEGLYGGMTGNQGGTLPSQTAHGIGLGAFGGVVPILWSTGWNFLGASYSVAVIQPFVTAFAGQDNGLPVPGGVNANTTCAGSSLGALNANSLCAWQQMIINTVWQPLSLSWNLGNGWFTSVAFSFQGPDGTRVTGTANPDFWTFSPSVAVSYLSANWNASINMVYQIYTASQGITGAIGGTAPANGFIDGNQFAGDLHALYKLGKWEFGPVGYFVVQTTTDRPGGGFTCATPNLCGNQNFVGVGGLVGYDFGPVDLQVWATDTVWSQNTAEAGWTIWSRIGFRLWAPEAPKPLVAKN